MQYQWMVQLLVSGNVYRNLQAVGRLLTEDWFPYSFHGIAIVGMFLYVVYLERGFCKKQKKGGS